MRPGEGGGGFGEYKYFQIPLSIFFFRFFSPSKIQFPFMFFDLIFQL